MKHSEFFEALAEHLSQKEIDIVQDKGEEICKNTLNKLMHAIKRSHNIDDDPPYKTAILIATLLELNHRSNEYLFTIAESLGIVDEDDDDLEEFEVIH